MEYYCGIDLGTSSVKVMLLGADGTVAGTESAGYDIRKHSPCEAEQDMEYLWQRTRQSIAALLGKYPEAAAHIRGISFSGQMHGMVAVDKNGKAGAGRHYLGRPALRGCHRAYLGYHI